MEDGALQAYSLIGDPEARRGEAEQPARPRRSAIATAILFHLAILVAILVRWETSPPSPPVPPPSIPVRLILRPPQPARPSAARPREQVKYRESGPDERTAGPPIAPPARVAKDEPAAAPPAEQHAAPEEAASDHPADQAKLAESEASKAPPPPPLATPDAVPTPAPKQQQPPVKAKPAQAKEPPETHQPRKTAASVQPPRHPVPNREEASKEMSGDPYLNLLLKAMEKHKTYPALARPLGLTGTAYFIISIDRGGNLVAMKLRKSSGSELLDRAGEEMIRKTAPFPPPPSDFPVDRIITVDIPFAPN